MSDHQLTPPQAYRHSDPTIDQALDWAVVLKAGGHPSAETVENFETWLNASYENRTAWDEVTRLWGLPEVMIASTASRDKNIKLVPSSTKPQRLRVRHIRWRGAAFAAVAASVLILFGPTLYQTVSIDAYADYQTTVGQLKNVTLPDGSRMILDTQTAVAVDFAGTTRSVRLLKGEVWFDVVHDASRPFTVSASFSDVEVKGTAFTVGTDKEMDTVTVERGHVQTVHRNLDIASIDLTAGERVSASPQSFSAISKLDTEYASGWKEGLISLSDTPLKTALDTIGRYYDGNVVLLNTSLQDVAISGSYRIDNVVAAIDSAVFAAGGKTTHLPGGFIIIR